MRPIRERRHRLGWLLLLPLIASALIGLLLYRWLMTEGRRSVLVWEFLRNSQDHADWLIQAGERCGDAPFLLPTSGFVGYLWGDSFRPGHLHQGIDIFGGEGLNQTAVVAAYSGYLTRQVDWKASLIIRIPADPLQPDRQIWTYYTHTANPEGTSFIAPQFPPGTSDVFVEAGSLLGFQGNYSGDPFNPTGIHLHFSIDLDDGQGHFRNELEFHNTIDPSSYLGLPLNAERNKGEIPRCTSSFTAAP